MKGGSPKVFISYRREDTSGHAGRLYDVVSGQYGDANVFMDVDIAPGVDFVNRITDAVGECHVLLVIMGPRWATIRSQGAALPRIADPEDFVRLEVETGLARRDVTVIPVLVGGARMPAPETLPERLRHLSRRNAIELSDTRWKYDVDRLMMHLNALLADTSAVHPVVQQPRQEAKPPPAAAAAPNVVTLVLGAALVAAAGGALGRGLAQLVTTWPKDTHGLAVADQVASRAITWLVVGFAVATWLTARMQRGGPWAGNLLFGALTGGLTGALAGFLVSAPVELMDPPASDSTRDVLAVLGFAIVGAGAGAVVGRVWHGRVAAGIVGGMLMGALVQVVVEAAGWDVDHKLERVLQSSLYAALIVGLVAVTLAASERRQRISTGVPTGVRL